MRYNNITNVTYNEHDIKKNDDDNKTNDDDNKTNNDDNKKNKNNYNTNNYNNTNYNYNNYNYNNYKKNGVGFYIGTHNTNNNICLAPPMRVGLIRTIGATCGTCSARPGWQTVIGVREIRSRQYPIVGNMLFLITVCKSNPLVAYADNSVSLQHETSHLMSSSLITLTANSSRSAMSPVGTVSLTAPSLSIQPLKTRFGTIRVRVG
jgi:hypothetical protein